MKISQTNKELERRRVGLERFLQQLLAQVQGDITQVVGVDAVGVEAKVLWDFLIVNEKQRQMLDAGGDVGSVSWNELSRNSFNASMGGSSMSHFTFLHSNKVTVPKTKQNKTKQNKTIHSDLMFTYILQLHHVTNCNFATVISQL